MTDKKVTDITMEAGVYLNEEHINLYVYLGEEATDPVFDESICYEDCIEEFFEMITVRDTQIKDAEYEAAEKFINKLENMVTYARNTLADLERI